MFLLTLFILSGAIIITLIIAKRLEERRRNTNFILRAISRGDERVRSLHLTSLHSYSEGKDKAYFWITKQLPLRGKNLYYKLQSMTREMADKYVGNVRDSRLLKRSDGISEFFKNMGELERGNGEINEIYMSEREIVEEVKDEVLDEPEVEVPPLVEVTEAVEDKPVKLLRRKQAPRATKEKVLVAPEPIKMTLPKARKAPRRKSVEVLEVL